MKVNRADFLRVLRVIKSVKVNEVKFDKNGEFGVVSDDRGVLLFGKGIPFGFEFGLIDIGMLMRMLSCFNDIEVEIDYDKAKNKLMLCGSGDLVFGYRLADLSLIEGISRSILENKKGQIVEVKIPFEKVVEMRNLIRTLGVGEVSFEKQQGALKVVIGKEKFFYGVVFLEMLEEDIKSVEFRVDALLPILDVLDENVITFGFLVEDDGKNKVNDWLIIKEKDFEWYIGCLKEEAE